MKVHGSKIEDQVLSAAFEWARAQKGRFTAGELTEALIGLGVPRECGAPGDDHPKLVAYRVAGRLLQSWKSSGLLVPNKRGWIVAPDHIS